MKKEENKMSDHYYTTEVEYRGCFFEIEVYYDYSEGGSNSYGSDEPAWVDVDVTSIYGAGRTKPVSKRLSSALMSEYGQSITQSIAETHGA